MPVPLFSIWQLPIRIIKLNVDKPSDSPPPGYRWKILCGEFYHINGTDSYLRLMCEGNPSFINIVWETRIDDQEATGNYSIFAKAGNTAATVTIKQADFQDILVDAGETLSAVGGSGYSVTFKVLEIKRLDKETEWWMHK